VAEFLGMTCMFPVDLTKIQLQNQHGKATYKEMVDHQMKIVQTKRFLGMYRGAEMNLTWVTLEKSVKLAANDFWQLLTEDGMQGNLKMELLACGAAVCQVNGCLSYESLKIQLQDGLSLGFDLSTFLFQVLQDCLGFLPQVPFCHLHCLGAASHSGLGWSLQECGATLLRDIPFSIIYLPLFTNLNNPGFRLSFAHSFMSGCVAGSVAAVTVTPLDILKTQIQTLKKGQGDNIYSRVPACWLFLLPRKLWIQEGPSAFMKGAGCQALVIAPLFGMAQGIYFLGIRGCILNIPRPFP
uniref:Solute carrier family 25 member 18 n=1 Tax=Otolemur garnettii TaxID=30611 RepID=H0XRN1_OTOGA